MTTFDKLCAFLTIPIGVIFILLGIAGLFVGSNAHFTLPPILGGLPFFLGWSMCVTLIRYWRSSNPNEDLQQGIQSWELEDFLNDHPTFRDQPRSFQRAVFEVWRRDKQQAP